MPKNIIICSDGTGNTAIKGRGTNVFKMFEAIDLNGHRTNPNLDPQLAFYDDGVGTETFLPLKLLGGAFGFGLAKNVRNLYMDLVRVYDSGDRIFLFGFSRGAFTVRTLAGLITKCGVLDRAQLATTDALRAAVRKAYRTYRRSYRTWLGRILRRPQRDLDAMLDFKVAHSLPGDVRTRFIGVWDTVDAVGGPFHLGDVINAVFRRFKFPDQKLSDKIDWAAHALSIDDARAAFEPVLWEAKPNIEQVWFAGVHSNVGGGYPKQGMSLVTLDWMMQKAQRRGLRILLGDRRYCSEHGSVDDKLYDSRAGLGVFYRWKPRLMQRLCEKQKAAMPPAIHLSVFERIAHGTDGYAPGTIAQNAEVVFTPIDDPQQDAALAARADAVKSALDQTFAKSGCALEQVRGTVALGRLARCLCVVCCLAPVFSDPWLIGALSAGFVLSGALACYADRRRSLVYSRYWHDARQDLRTALKDARNALLLGRA